MSVSKMKKKLRTANLKTSVAPPPHNLHLLALACDLYYRALNLNLPPYL